MMIVSDDGSSGQWWLGRWLQTTVLGDGGGGQRRAISSDVEQWRTMVVAGRELGSG